MSPRPTIFVSAVSKELKSARQLVSNTLQFLGYEPVWQDVFGTEQGDLRAMLRRKIDDCGGVVQLVGKCYGFGPPRPDETFGRVSYTQYEAFYARQRGKKVWYLYIDDNFPTDPHAPESAELSELQETYRRRLMVESHLYHRLSTREALESSVLKLRDDLANLRRGVKQWAFAVIALLLVLLGAMIVLEHGQNQISDQQKRLLEALQAYPQTFAHVSQEAAAAAKNGSPQTAASSAELEQKTYDELAQEYGVSAGLLQEFAHDLQNSTKATAYQRAIAAFMNKNFADANRLALLAAEEVLKASPPDNDQAAKALKLAGLAADIIGNSDDAINDYNEAIDLKPHYAEAYIDRGDAKINKADYDGAMADFTKAIELKPDLVVAFNNRAWLEEKNGDHDAAIADYTKVIESDPGSEDAYNNRGLSKYNKGDMDGAIADYTKAIELKPAAAYPYFNRALADEKKYDADGAIADCDKTIELDPDLAEVYNIRGLARGYKGDHIGALVDYTRAIELKHDYTVAYYDRANEKSLKGDQAGAIADFSKAIELKPDFAGAYCGRGNAKIPDDIGDGGIDDLTKAIELRPGYADAYYFRGLAKDALNDHAGAIPDYLKDIELKPDDAAAYKLLALAKKDTGDYQGAIDAWQKAVQINPSLLAELQPKIDAAKTKLGQ
ncbi:MAG TPA: tetratricopeptide repeat protein [Candidatus Sulfotelmatobacter sp.]|jgi:tetratricopeptide (TPR) repeat protein|nr:tetratricopeptide repeat protein [Candidatus Sulfotelmatobacter sp.]